jgi:hypothetical protein
MVRKERQPLTARRSELMAFTSPILERNRELARQINEEALRNPNSPYANKCVGLINGQVFVVGDNLDEVIRQLRAAEPDPLKCFFIEASRDYSKVEYIWDVYECRA